MKFTNIIKYFYNPILRAEYKGGKMYVERKYSKHEYIGSCAAWFVTINNGENITRCSFWTESVLTKIF